MADLFDYLHWRGDLSFSAVPHGPVDALIFSNLAYLHYDGIVAGDLQSPVTLQEAAAAFLLLSDTESRVRTKTDLSLLRRAAEAPRFRNVKLAFYRSIFIPEEETQFAAVAFLLEDGSAFLAFRGTDYSLVGWKEDFNMSFLDSVPAQREAAAYTVSFGAAFIGPLILGGHSKGGNLAVYAGSQMPLGIQNRIRAVYSLDGPGFTDALMGSAGYLQLVPRIHTYIPESSIIGILLEHEEPYTVIKSRQISILQHELYSWEIARDGFVHLDEISSGSRFADRTIKNWISGMTPQERGEFVDALFSLLSAGGASQVWDLLHPKSILAFLRTLRKDEKTKKLLSGEMTELLKAAGETISQLRKKRNSHQGQTVL